MKNFVQEHIDCLNKKYDLTYKYWDKAYSDFQALLMEEDLRALFQARMCTWVEPPMFCKLVGHRS